MPNTNGYQTTWIEASAGSKPCVAAIRRPDGRVMTSAMLGDLNGGKMLATLDQLLDLALATLSNDGEVTIAFPRVGALS